MKQLKIIIGAGIILTLFLVFNFIWRERNPAPTSGLNQDSASQDNFKKQINSEGEVSVSVLPKNITNKIWEFEVELNTHSVELSEDLTQVSFLIKSEGEEEKPIAWEGDLPAGPHRKGVLKFNALSPQPAFIILKIREVGGVKERIFQWRINQ